MSKKRKYIIISIVALLSLLIAISVVLGVIAKIEYWKHGVGSYEVRDFKSNKDAFETLALKAVDCYEQEKAKNKELYCIIIYIMTEDTWQYNCKTDYHTNVNDYNVKKEISAKENEAYLHVAKLFSKTDAKWLYSIRVTKDGVIFASESPYAIIYMRDGGTPECIYSEKEMGDLVYKEKISRKWYQVMVK